MMSASSKAPTLNMEEERLHQVDRSPQLPILKLASGLYLTAPPLTTSLSRSKFNQILSGE